MGVCVCVLGAWEVNILHCRQLPPPSSLRTEFEKGWKEAAMKIGLK